MTDKQHNQDRIGTPDPKHEPEPPRIDDAGDLGPVGENKQRGELPKPGIWGDRPPTKDENIKEPAARVATPEKVKK